MPGVAEPYLQFRYRVIRVWELPVDTVLKAGISVLPLAPISAVSQNELPAVIERIKKRFAAEWTTPLVPRDGISRDAWLAAEHHIGAELPAALREAYLLFGRRPDLTARQDRLVPPHQLGPDESGSVVMFRVENQHCAAWGVAVADLASADPPVYVRDRDGGAGSRSWTACRWRARRWCSARW